MVRCLTVTSTNRIPLFVEKKDKKGQNKPADADLAVNVTDGPMRWGTGQGSEGRCMLCSNKKTSIFTAIKS